jgi:FkbM family methyltransferase
MFKLLLTRLRNGISEIARKHCELSFAQSGEDILLRTLFGDAPTGFYVDVGANHPFIQSNTYFFYRRGWSGINIDPLPGSMKKFKLLRPRDINLEAAVSDSDGIVKYYMFPTSFYNTASEDAAKRHFQQPARILEVKTRKLSQVLSEHRVAGGIDFLSVDTEGMELPVLRSNDWNRFRPRAVLLESFVDWRKTPAETENAAFLAGVGYKLCCNTATNCIFLENEYFRKRSGL